MYIRHLRSYQQNSCSVCLVSSFNVANETIMLSAPDILLL